MTKPTPFFILTILTILLTALCLWIMVTARNYAVDQGVKRILQSETQLWEPPTIIRKPGQGLWEAMIYEEKDNG